MSTVSDVLLGIKIALKYGETIRAGINEANGNAKIVSAIAAAYAALTEFHTDTGASVQTVIAEAGLTPQQIAQALDPAGQSQPQV